ncbi:cuticle protein-like [Varroa destructor]|uniref:Cuticle protein n=1 Tax=Varroa destructor TaxID=109461 RepID=A0A7M7JD07_VARDE|nr:cuticle protein-like [Varroa destructor]
MFTKVIIASVAIVTVRAGAIAAPAYDGYGLAAAPALAAPAYHGYANAAPLAHAAPLAYAAAAPIAKVAAAPLAYAAAAPIAKVAAAPIVAKAAIAYPPQPYQFGYESVDEYGTKQARHEVSDAYNNKKGSYSFTDAHGIARHVDYVADAAGFRATIKTNEPGTAPSAPAAALYNAAPIAVKTVAAAPIVKAVAAAPVAAYAHAPAYGHYVVIASIVIATGHVGGQVAPAYGYGGGHDIAAASYGYGHAAPLAYAAAAPIAKVAAAPVITKAAIDYPPQPYQFGYESVDEYGTKQSRHEVSDGDNNKKGSYSFSDAHGIARHVEYVADKLGFRASIKTNEPGTAPSAPAAAHYHAAPVAVKPIAPAPIATYAHAPAHGSY